MTPLSPKVSVGAASGAGSTPLSIVIVWLIGLTGIVVPETVAISIGALIAAGATLVTGYLQREHVLPPIQEPKP